MQIKAVQFDSLTDTLLNWCVEVSVLINFPLITLSLMNLLVQTSSHSPKNYGRDMQAGLMAIPNQARK